MEIAKLHACIATSMPVGLVMHASDAPALVAQADNWQANVVLWPAAAMEEKDRDRRKRIPKTAAVQPDEDPDNGHASSDEEATDTDGAPPFMHHILSCPFLGAAM